MKHTTLYRKWRPRRFGEIVGQEPVVRTLERAIETGRVSHAYLFSGPRGTGKTSTAKVLAMGLNCAQGPTPEPDGACESCRAITTNSSLDVVEMDAASNRGIDEIRELRDRVNLAPVAGRKKVYIIDEVHMLTPEAFNALLKMLEEPPEHVVFVLATTEKHKVLPTIISRCQSFEFRRPGVETLKEKLAEIAEAEGIEVEPEALTVIARGGGGSFRDAEGLLDQLSSFSDGGITASMVRELLGSVGPEALLETTAALHERRAADALRVIDRLSNEGKDLGQFASELLSHLRNLMLLPYAPEIALSGVGADERGPLEEQSKIVPTAEVVRLIEALGDTRGRIKRGGDPKLELELSFLKLTRDYTEPQVDSLLRRLETLERAVENGAFAADSAPRPQQDETQPVIEVHDKREIEEEGATRDGSQSPNALEGFATRRTASTMPAEDTGQTSHESSNETEAGDVVFLDWQLVMRELRHMGRRGEALAGVYENARNQEYKDGVLRLVFDKDMENLVKAMTRNSSSLEPLREALVKSIGVKPSIDIGIAEESSADPPSNARQQSSREVGERSIEERSIEQRSGIESSSKSGPEATPKFPGESEAGGDGPLVPEQWDDRNAGSEEPSSVSDYADSQKRRLQAEAERHDDRIGSEEEVFNLALEWRDSRDPNGGN